MEQQIQMVILVLQTGEVFPAEFESVIANLDVNDVSSAVSYENNTHFLKVTEIKGSGATTLEEKQQNY